MEDFTSKQLGSYLIVYRFEAGGIANVFKAYHPRMGRYVATEDLLGYFSKNFQLAKYFSPEIHLIEELEQPHILPLQDFEEADYYTYLTICLLVGCTLSSLLKKHNKLELTKLIVSFLRWVELSIMRIRRSHTSWFKSWIIFIDKFKKTCSW